MNILFFTENLYFGGKERRLLELIMYLKKNTDYSIALVITEPLIHYINVYNLNIPVKIIKRKLTKYDPLVFIKFCRYCYQFRPDIIHAWGRMSTFYAVPAKLIFKVPLISNLIADAKRSFRIYSLSNFFFKMDIFFSDTVLSNSMAGLKAYGIRSSKAKVIWNGVDLERFTKNFDIESVRNEFGIKSLNVIIMVATFTKFKDYDLFLDVAKGIEEIRSDTSFVAVGDGPELNRIKKRAKEEGINNVIFTGPQTNVESIIAASDIGILTTYSEGVSNSIMEYMALGKPVITSDLNGGSNEIIVEGDTGYCMERSLDKIIQRVIFLLDNADVRIEMGRKGRQRVFSLFSIEKMGEDFKRIYENTVLE
jgi:glycosyltransferase involved in cell wall biosynthesis